MAQSSTAKPSPQAVKESNAMWGHFVSVSKVSTYLVVAILFLLWLFFIAL